MAPRKHQFNSEHVPRLINEVRKRPCIWSQDDNNYNDRYHVLCAWRDITKHFEFPEEVLKMKWKNLRDLFNREKRKHKVTSVEQYPGRWQYFQDMWFIYKPDDVVFMDSDDNTDINDTHEHNKIEITDEGEETEYLEPDMLTPNREEIFLNDLNPRYTDHDYDMMYLKSLTPYFSLLEPMRKLIVRSKIQDMLLNEIAAQQTQTANKK